MEKNNERGAAAPQHLKLAVGSLECQFIIVKSGLIDESSNLQPRLMTERVCTIAPSDRILRIQMLLMIQTTRLLLHFPEHRARADSNLELVEFYIRTDL